MGTANPDDVLAAVRLGCTVAELGKQRFANGERHLKTPAEMIELFADYPEAVARTLEVADRCSFSLDELRYEYPEELCPPGTTPLQYLTRLTEEGARQRFPAGVPGKVTFDRRELNRILGLYGRMVAAGEWRDYAIDFLKERAVFSVFRRASEVPLYRIEKRPKLRQKQGLYAVIAATGHILKRGHDLAQVLRVFETRRPQLVE